MAVVKVLEIIGTSKDGWQDAAEQCIEEATKTVKNVVGVDIIKQTASVNNGKIDEFRVTCHIAFKVER